MILLKWWLIKPCQSSFKRLLNIEPGWYTYLTDPQSISYHFMVNPLHFLTAKQRHIQLQDSHTCTWGSNFTKHRSVKIILKNFPGYFFFKKIKTTNQPHTKDLNTMCNSLCLLRCWRRLDNEWTKSTGGLEDPVCGAVPSLSLFFGLGFLNHLLW